MATATIPRMTADELLRMPDGNRFELVDGELVEKRMGMRSSAVGGHVHRLLANHVVANRLGIAIPEASYQCYTDEPEKVRRPDVSFIRAERLPLGELPEGHCRIVPDLVVEVVSPSNHSSPLEAKVDEYLDAGVRLVWVVDPPNKSVRMYRADGTTSRLRGAAEITGEDIVPGFQCSIAEFFVNSWTLPQS